MDEDLRKEILEKIHLAVRTAFFNEHQKNMQFLADDIMALIASYTEKAYKKGFDEGRIQQALKDSENLKEGK
jgi:pyruvate/oxaloacetate carboxyltransferase